MWVAPVVFAGFAPVASALGVFAPGGFALAGPDHHFYWAKAVIEGKKVVVTCDQVPAPVTVRYGWADSPVCTSSVIVLSSVRYQQ